MEHLKVKGWSFYNSIGRKVVEPEKKQVRVEMRMLSEGDLFSIKLGGETCELCKIGDDYIYINLSNYLYGSTCGNTHVYKIENYPKYEVTCK